VLYQHSVWAHGYIHGYETGFHWGNFDMQVSGGARAEKMMKSCRNPKHHYNKSFGSRSTFESGFREGFKAGYADGVTGEAFRAATTARTLVTSHDQLAGLPVDEGIANGYIQGRTQGLSDARIAAAFTPGKALCPRDAGDQNYCGSYALGFRWGYSDGYHNQRPDFPTRSALRRP
jgi:hypothetical protein